MSHEVVGDFETFMVLKFVTVAEVGVTSTFNLGIVVEEVEMKT